MVQIKELKVKLNLKKNMELMNEQDGSSLISTLFLFVDL